jgi:uroporphyrinogen decarboxylase
MNKREAMLSLLDESAEQTYVPAAFFLHFDPIYHRGRGAVDKHLEYFRYTNMDFVKIQYENSFPRQPEIQRPENWPKMPVHQVDFYQDQLDVVAGLVEEAKDEALVLITLYSPFMCAGQASGGLITEHIRQDPEKAKKGIEIVTESLLIFVRECVKRGVDGFYASTQGAEAFRFDDPALFAGCIKPYDLAIMEEINRTCTFNILHVCDYNGPYDNYAPVLNYPGHVVNCSLHLGSGHITPVQAAEMFDRPYMGGLERKGVIASGSQDEVKAAVKDLLRQAPPKYVLGADCTVPGDTDWDNLRAAIATAHAYKGGHG